MPTAAGPRTVAELVLEDILDGRSVDVADIGRALLEVRAPRSLASDEAPELRTAARHLVQAWDSWTRDFDCDVLALEVAIEELRLAVGTVGT